MTQLYALVAFLFPLGIYCLILAEINRRPAPVLVSGAWDTVGLLLASSGFFLGTAPLLFDEFAPRHYLIWTAYYLLLASVALALIRWRRAKTMIYNIDADRLDHRLQESLASLGLSVAGRGSSVVVANAAEAAASIESRPVEVEIETFPSLCHVTLHWGPGTSQVRNEVERQLQKVLAGAAPEENPVAGWMMSVSGLIFGMLAMLAGASCVLSLPIRRWL